MNDQLANKAYIILPHPPVSLTITDFHFYYFDKNLFLACMNHFSTFHIKDLANIEFKFIYVSHYSHFIKVILIKDLPVFHQTDTEIYDILENCSF